MLQGSASENRGFDRLMVFTGNANPGLPMTSSGT